MRADHIARARRSLGAVVGGGFLALGVAELAARIDDPLPLLFWLPTLWGGGVLVLLGVFGLASHPALRAVSVVAGTCLGLVPSFWTIVMPVLGLTLIFLTLAYPVRPPVATEGDA